jgi:CIC family chloride channel protein
MFRAPRLPSLNDLAAFARLFEFRAVSRWVGLGVLVGIASGASAVVFLAMSEAVRHFLLDELANLKMLEPGGEGALFPSSASGAPRAWVLLLVPAVGGIVSGLLVRVFCPEAAGGNEGFINAFHRGRGRTRKRVAVVKSVAAALFIGSGNSAGREGPIAHVGASLGSMLGEAFKLSDRERRLLLVAGAAGGIYDEDIAKVAVAADCMMPLVAVSLEDTLATALARFASSHYRELPVIDDDRVKGLLGYEELLQAYSAELVRRRLES